VLLPGLSAAPAVATEPDEIQRAIADFVATRPQLPLCRERRRATLEIEQVAGLIHG
jgi:hypothetical protein